MKRVLFFLLLIVLGTSVMAQQKIQFRSADRAECVKSDMNSLKASFSFSTIEAEDYSSDRGTFSWLSLPNTVLGGNVGEPQIPVVNELIAVPFGAQPRIEITSYSSTDYNLADYDMKTLVPRQLPVRKDKNPDEVPFVMNEAAYQTRGFRSEPMATVSVEGTMRGIQLGTMTIEPISYDPVNNTMRVFNDIEVTVHFDGADAQTTEDMLLKTYSPAFEPVYEQLFNGRAVRDVYTDHPDLYNTPVKMLVICYSGFQGNDALNSWLEWKLQKGYYVDIYYTGSGTNNAGTTSSAIASFIKTKYNASVSAGNAYTYLVVIGDTGQVPQYMTKYIDSTAGNCASDLGYAAVNFTTSSTSNYFPDMYYSRISVENTTQLTSYLNKVLTYEKFEFTDGGNYLNNVLLVAGYDSGGATNAIGKPTVNYGKNNYFNKNTTTYGGFGSGTINVVISTSSSQGYSGSNNGVYNGINNGACLVNYTAHGDKQEWQIPQFTAAQAATLTNTGKYFFCIGNCCLTGNYNNTGTSYSPGSTIGTTASFGETMMRVPNAGAIAYIGCSPYSYWYEDFYWAVGAHSFSSGNAPSVSASSTGVYDAMFIDGNWNSASALLYLGNLAVQQAVTNGNDNSSISGSGEGGDCNNSAHYYFQFYHTFGDGSIMPYITKPETNTVTHASTINIGATTFTVSAIAGSYVSITKDNEILGVAEVPSNGTVNVPISGLTSAGDVKIVVTRQQYQPYITTIQAISTSGPYISLDSYTPNIALIGETTNLSMTFKNVGTAATSGTTTVTLSSSDANLVVDQGTKTFSALAANATTTVSGFQFQFKSTATVGFNYTIHYTATNGNNVWEGDITVTADQVYTVNVASNNNGYGTVSGGGQYHYGASCTVTATPADGYMFTNWTQNGNVVSTDASYTITVSSNVSLTANFASGVMIGDGSSSSSEYLPTYNYYNYSLTEQIYTSAELGGAGAITSIAFYNEGAEKTRTLDFYLKATTKNSFSSKTDWITVSSSDKVFSGSVTLVANDWTTITLSNPFVYDGTSNVVLVTDDNSNAYTSSPHMACRVFNANGNQTIYIYSDGTNYNPSSPTTSQSSNYDVLSVKNQIILTKEAISTEPVTIKVSANPEQAATVTGGGEYTFGETCTVTATPNANYTFTGWTENGNTVSSELSFSFTATSDRDLVANFIQAIEIGTGTSTHNYLPTYNYYNYSMTEQIYTADEIGVAGTINSIAFYNEGAEKTRTLDFYLKATTKESFSSKTDWVTVASSDKVFSGEVTLAANAWTFINFTAPFEYDGNSNLVLVVDDNSGAYTSSPHLACSVYNANGTQSIYIYSDGTNYDPSSPTTSQSSNYATLSVKNHLLMGITVNTGTQYTITATANPTEGGTITGAGTYYENGTCRLTATANTDYAFVNWTKDGAVVSTNTTYSFTVTEDADYVANFNYVKEYNVKIMPNDPDYGSVAFGRNRETLTYDFEDGWQGWTTFQGSTTSPHSWMHNTEYVAYDSNGDQIVPECHDSSSGMMLSESYISASTSGGGDAQAVTPDNYLVSPQFRLGGSFTFYAASRMSNYPAEKFSVLVSESGNTSASSFTHTELTVTLSDNSWNEYTIDLSNYSGMGYVAIRHYDCNDQHLLYIDDVTIVEGEVTDGSVTATYVHGTSSTVTATPNEGFYFANWTENGNVVSSDASYTFTVTSDRDLTANFQDTPPTVEQTVDLVQGWNWFVPTVDITLEELEAALGTNGISIMSQNSGSLTYDDGDDEWTGYLTELVPGEMYIIQVNGDVEFTLNGNPMSTTPVTITINEGYNWFGFTGDEVNINTALSGFNAVDGDCIMAFGDESSTSYDGDDEEWTGHLTTLKPGHGYIYISKDPTPKQLTFQGK